MLRSAIKYAAELAILLTAAFFALNDALFHISGVPTAIDAARFFGNAPKPYVKLNTGEASVSFIDVGQGDCELILTEYHSVLIDSGEFQNADTVIGFLKYAGVESLDLVIISHPHSDHYGAMYKVLSRFGAGLVIMPDLPKDMIPYGVTYNNLMGTLKSKNIPYRAAQPGEKFILGENSFIEITAPHYNDYPSVNNCSIVARFVHGENSFLFTGDLQEEAEHDLVHDGAQLKADVLKAAHHGSEGSSTPEFLKAVSPQIVVFEAAETNSYGHPRRTVLERLREANCKAAYSTASNGNIVIVTDGKELQVFTEKEAAYSLAA